MKHDSSRASLEGLAALGARYRLNGVQTRRLGLMIGHLATTSTAPTSVRRPSSALRTHLADSLVALELGPVRDARSLVDLGSGAGFPGLPLALALPGAEVGLLESQRRKCAFLEAALAVVEVRNAHVVCARAEEWGEGLAAHDVALARALAPRPVVLEYAAPLLRVGGSLVDWRGGREPQMEAAALCAGERLGMRLREVRHVMPFEGAERRHLHIWEKVAPTPVDFPRRAGVARKRPLGC